MAWRTLSSRTVYENQWIRVREDEVVLPADTPGIYGVVELRHPAVFVVAIDDEERVCFVTVSRYTTGASSLEVPAGGSDGEHPLAAARRELVEETGLEAAEWTQLGSIQALNGVADAVEHVFLARSLRRVADPAAQQRAEGIESMRWIPLAQIPALLEGGAIRDGETIAALALAAVRLGRWGGRDLNP